MDYTTTYDEAVDEVVADGSEMLLRDTAAVQRLAEENRGLFQKIRSWLRKWLENIRKAFDGVGAEHAEAKALEKHLEELQKRWDDALVGASRNLQRSRAEAENKAAESDGKKASVRGKYWRPNLNRSEWNLLNRRMTEEIESSGQYLDESTKWLYADEKGVQVFALYGIGDGTEATPLYAVGGEKALKAHEFLTSKMEVLDNEAERNRENVGRWISGVRGDEKYDRYDTHALGRTGTVTNGTDQLHGGTPNGDSERIAGKGNRNGEVKFSLRDSAGRELTAAQQAYFRDSQVRDAGGNLKVVYHGSAAIFTKFSADFMSQNGSSEGQGFYFTDYKPMAQGYEKNGGQLLEGYLDIKKPLSDSEVTLSAAEVKRLIRVLDPTGDDLVLNYDSRGGMGYPSRTWYNRSVEDTLRATMSTSDSDSEILAELANGMGDPGKVLKTTRELLGYDGYIVEGKYDDATVYVAFDSSQFKNVTNQNPTGDADIRYSARDYGLTEDEEHAIVSYKSGDSYSLNGKLATGGELTELQRSLRDHLDTALEKLPVYKGTVYRHYDFDSFGGYDAMADFLSQFVKGEKTNLGGYLSASTVPNESRTGGEYTVDMVIQSETGRSLNGFGRNTENEVLLPRTTELIADSMELISPHKIRMTAREVINDENGATADPTLSGVRRMRESAPGRENLRPVSGRDSGAVQEEMGRPAGRDRDAGLSGLREGEGSGSLGESGVESDYRAAEEGLKYQPREQSVSDRQILANALERVAQNERERSILADYREKAAKMAFYERELSKREQKIADHRSGKAILEPDKLRRAEISANKYAALISGRNGIF